MKKLFLCHEKVWIQIRILQRGLDPDIKYSDPQHCFSLPKSLERTGK